MIMEGEPFVLIEGMIIAGLATGATKGYVYTRSEYPDAIRIMNEAIEVARANKLLGPKVLGSDYAFDMEVRMGAGAYVCGEETSLLNSMEGKRGLFAPSRRFQHLRASWHGRRLLTTLSRCVRCR